MSIRPKSTLAALAVATALSLSLAACSGGGDSGESSEPAASSAAESSAASSGGGIVEGGTLHVSLTGDPGNIDPTINETLAASTSYTSWCEALYYDTVEVEPMLALDFPVFADDAMSATIELRQDAVFADGEPYNAEAEARSLERHRTHAESARAMELKFIESIEVVDEYTIKLNFTGPMAPGVVISALAGRASMAMSPKALDEGDEAFNANPICVGPFKYDSRIPQTSMTVVRDPLYYDADKVHLDKIVYDVVPDSAVRLTQLRAGDLQVVDRVTPSDLIDLESEPTINLVTLPGLGYHNLVINIYNEGAEKQAEPVDRPLARSLAARQALALAIDREAINEIVYEGLYEPAYSSMVPGSEFATEKSTAALEYNPEKAKQLLEESGETLPVKFTITLNQMPELRKVAELIKEQADAVGFEVELETMESTAAVAKGDSGDFDIYYNSYTGTADPDSSITRVISTKSAVNMGMSGNEETEALLQSAREELDSSKRAEIYAELTKYIQDNVTTIFLLRPANFIAHADNGAGFLSGAPGAPVVKYAYFTE
jgi:peptide/nickel transport system substrate-binding protein